MDKETAARYWDILKDRHDLTDAEATLMVEVMKTLNA